jgi:hypothetical protein
MKQYWQQVKSNPVKPVAAPEKNLADPNVHIPIQGVTLRHLESKFGIPSGFMRLRLSAYQDTLILSFHSNYDAPEEAMTQEEITAVLLALGLQNVTPLWWSGEPQSWTSEERLDVD